MTDMEQALTISGIIFATMLLSQFGRREYTLHKIVMPIASVATVGWFYLGDMPTAGVDWIVYGVGALIGIGFGAVATATTGVERDHGGAAFTRCGAGFVGTWLAVIALRVAFIALAEHDAAFRSHLGAFMLDHGIVQDAIAPFFVIMALAMVLARVAMVWARVQAAPSPARPAVALAA